MGEQAIRIGTHGESKMAAGLKFPTGVEVIESLNDSGLSLVRGGSNGQGDAAGKLSGCRRCQGLD